MFSAEQLDCLFEQFLTEAEQCTGERWVTVDDDLLQSVGIDLAKLEELDPTQHTYFFVLESASRVALMNEEFIIWLLPVHTEPKSSCILIARNEKGRATFELMIQAQGRYNTPAIVLTVLERHLKEIRENQALLEALCQQ